MSVVESFIGTLAANVLTISIVFYLVKRNFKDTMIGGMI